EHEGRRLVEWLNLRERELEQIRRSLGETGGQPSDAANDLVALTLDAATLAVRDRRSDAKLAELYRAALDVDPQHRLALFHLEALLRKVGCSEEVAALEERLADCFDDPRAKAALLTRAGEALAI